MPELEAQSVRMLVGRLKNHQVDPIKLRHFVATQIQVIPKVSENVVIEDPELKKACDNLYTELFALLCTQCSVPEIDFMWKRMALHALTGEGCCSFFNGL
jgi:hypothetical protein